MNWPRVAFFADSFHEVNGAANSSRQLHAYAQRRNLPFLSVHAGARTGRVEDGSVVSLDLKRGGLAVPLDRDLKYDPFFWRHLKLVTGEVKAFKPDIVHITAPGDLGQMGAYLSHKLRVPLVASWHTNLHEFASRRIRKLLRVLPDKALTLLSEAVETRTLQAVLSFYRIARVVMSPNYELVDLLLKETGRPSFLMPRGIDGDRFSPDRRNGSPGTFRIGFVGRLTPEKNVRFLRKIEDGLLSAGAHHFIFSIVGDGSERGWLERHLVNVEFHGVLTGEELYRAYANFDVFVFPSEADAFGNVVLEALASGVPAVVNESGGPKFLVEHGESGLVASTDTEFIEAVLDIMSDDQLRSRMREAARRSALRHTWDSVFDRVYAAYAICLAQSSARHPATAQGRAASGLKTLRRQEPEQ